MNAEGQFPLSVAVHQRDLSCIDALATAKANVARAMGSSGRTGLHISVAANTSDVLFELLELKANPDLRDSKGATALWCAAQRNRSECAQLLVECGASVNLANNNGATPTFVALQEGAREALHVLFAAGADVTIARRDGVTPEQVARRCGTQGLLRSLKHLRKSEKKWSLPVI